MKSKPLIKTHWLASQNPMQVTLGGVKRVIFSPPPGVVNFDFEADPSTRIELPSVDEVITLPPRHDEMREVLPRSYTFAKDLYWAVFSGHDFSAFKVPPKELRALAKSIEFELEDGRTISFIGAFRLPEFPLFLDPKFYLLDRSCNWDRALSDESALWMKPLKVLDYQKRHGDFQRTWIVVLETLAWAFQRHRQVGDLEVVVARPGVRGEPREAFKLDEIEFMPPRPAAATVMSEKGMQATARMSLWQQKSTALNPNTLHLHATSIVEEYMDQGVSGYEARPEEYEALAQGFKTSNFEPSHWTPQYVAYEKDPIHITRILKLWKEKLGVDKVFFANRNVITPDAFVPSLKLMEEDGELTLSFSFLVKDLNLKYLNLPEYVAPLLKPFVGGLDSILGIDRKDVASKKKYLRANDLAFLRHQGMILFCLFEALNWRLGKPLSSGETLTYVEETQSEDFDKSFEIFLSYLKKTIPGLLGKSDLRFEEMLSTNVRIHFEDYIENLVTALSSNRTVFFHDGIVGEIHRSQERVLPLVRFLLLHFIESSDGKFLTRSQSPIAESFKQKLNEWTQPRISLADDELEPLQMNIGHYEKTLVPLLFELLDEDVEVELNGKPFLNHDNPFSFTFAIGDAEISDGSNWFDLHPEIFFNGERVDPEQVRFNFASAHMGFIEYKGQVYRIDKKQLPSFKSLQRFWRRINASSVITKHSKFGDKVFRLQRSQALELLMLKSQGIEVRASGEWKRIFEYFENGLGTEVIPLPHKMSELMLPHQREGAQWFHDLYELKLGAILADEMGLGKTFQVLAFLTSLQQRQKLGKCLIVVPTSLVYNWLDERNKFAPELPVHVFSSHELEKTAERLETNDPLVLITTYGLVLEHSEFFQSTAWNVLAFDEAQNLKNITSQRSVAGRQLRAEFKICLTGTPMENNYLEFFSLCDLVVPGSLGDIDSFRKRYYNQEVRVEALKELRLTSKPLLLRRTKQQVKLSLPVKTLQRVLLPFGEKQKEIYKKMAMAYSKQVEALIQEQGENRAQIAMFSALMRLRQICSDPSAVPGVVFEEKPVKVEHFLNSLQDHLENDESVIVFTQFISTLERIERELKSASVPVFTLQGKVSSKERLRLISEFQALNKPAVMLMTLKTGGVGLNLTKASVVYHLEPWWNPAVENQATDRAHRMGQTKDVKVYNLLIQGSLEERIADLKLKKQASFDRLFGDEEGLEEPSATSGGLTKDDFIYLLK